MTSALLRRAAGPATRSVPVLRSAAAALALLLAAPQVGAAQGLDALNEELRVSVARLQYALDKMRSLDFTLGVDDRRVRKDLLRDGKIVMERASRLGWSDEAAIGQTLDDLDGLRRRVDAFVESVVPAWEAPRTPRRAWRSPFQEVLKFHDIAEDALRAPGLNDRERAEVRERIREGEDIIAELKAVRGRDHVRRDELVRRLIDLRETLEDHLAASRLQRSPGYAFIPVARVAQTWTPLGHAEGGFTALRTRFVQPGSAHVTVRNDAAERRPLFLELELFDAAGDTTGSGVYETAPLEELRAGEVREVLVPIMARHPRLWTATRSFTVYLD